MRILYSSMYAPSYTFALPSCVQEFNLRFSVGGVSRIQPALMHAQISSSKPFNETCYAAVNGVFGVSCCDTPATCEVCLEDTANRISFSDVPVHEGKSNSPDGKNSKAGKTMSSARTGA
jgi:hypothetical protein